MQLSERKQHIGAEVNNTQWPGPFTFDWCHGREIPKTQGKHFETFMIVLLTDITSAVRVSC